MNRVSQAERLANQANHYSYGDGADSVTGTALATEGLVHAVLAVAEQFSQLVTAQTPAPPTYFLAEYEGVAPALFSTPETAREHCDDITRALADGRCWDWMPEKDGVQEQRWVHEDDDRPLYATGGTVTALRVDAEVSTPVV